jgi:polysaccharide export outer membrane protein
MNLETGRGGLGLALSAAASALPLKRCRTLVPLLAASALLSACAGTRGGPIPYNVAPTAFGNPDSPATKVLEEDYRVAPLDMLHVGVFEVPDLSGDFQVDLTGNITLPLIGSVRVVDMTTTQINQKVTQLLAAKYLQHPDVNVGVKSSSTRVVTVDGAVRSAGQFPVTGPLTLIQAVTLAHGTDDSANPHRVAVFRQIKGQRMAAAFDLTAIRRGQAEDPRIFAGDIVVVDGSKVKSVWQTVLTSLPLLSLFRPF